MSYLHEFKRSWLVIRDWWILIHFVCFVFQDSLLCDRPVLSNNRLVKGTVSIPVTAHAPNFDFWTGCREIKRCEESKRILKNPFASRLAGFNTTLKLLRIIDQ